MQKPTLVFLSILIFLHAKCILTQKMHSILIMGVKNETKEFVHNWIPVAGVRKLKPEMFVSSKWSVV